MRRRRRESEEKKEVERGRGGGMEEDGGAERKIEARRRETGGKRRREGGVGRGFVGEGRRRTGGSGGERERNRRGLKLDSRLWASLHLETTFDDGTSHGCNVCSRGTKACSLPEPSSQ